MNTHIKNALTGAAMGAVLSAALFAPMMAEAGTTSHVTHDGTNYGTGNNGKFVALPSPTNGTDGTDGQNGNDGSNGNDGADGVDGADGRTGDTGATGAAGKDAVAPLGSLSFAAASSSFYGDGIGFGLSASNYSSLEGSIVFGFDLDNDWRVVVGVTTDFDDRHAVSAGVGFSF